MDIAAVKADSAIQYDDTAPLPNKESAHVWSVQGYFFRRGRRKKVRGKGSVPTEDSTGDTPRRESIIRGQFLVISSCGGVGRKFEERHSIQNLRHRQ